MKKISIDECHLIAQQNDGYCLLNTYTSNKTNLIWKCKYGHEWRAILNAVKDGGTWCPYCSGRNNNSIELCVAIAEGRGGKVLSDKYFNNTQRLVWECKYNHTWYASLSSIKSGTWCPYCYPVFGNSSL